MNLKNSRPIDFVQFGFSGIVTFIAFLVICSVGVLMIAASFTASASPVSQSSSPALDEWSINNFFPVVDRAEYLYESPIDLNVYFQVQDMSGNFLSERIATAIEIQFYNFQRDDRINELARKAALATISLDPETGQKWETWIGFRTLDLIQCEGDAVNGLGLGNFNAMTNGEQNAVITSLLTCQEINGKVTRKMINTLFQVLVIDGLIVE